MELDEDEYIGEEISTLYDEKYCVLMLQRNRNSLSPTGIGKYFTSLAESGDLIELHAIPFPEELRKIKPNEYFRKIYIGFTPTKINDELLKQSNTSLLQIINGSRGLGALRVNITLSLGNAKKGETLNKDEIIELGNLQTYDGFNKIEISKRENEDTEIETVDLIFGKLYDTISLEVSKVNPIKYDRLIIIMQNFYNERIELFKQLYGEV